ncbi:serine-rich adhesin for platelets-like isoform X2 [Venturia canescens]|uniref:serine-rich adhesin for platelets-like isoform X2 n=1 Tax=Venturia canescens TaxID=32260 RepID=UPI001C9C8BD0|nr:serine-rich adhesin for platelets-like isoform X2 [Venturia canescens]
MTQRKWILEVVQGCSPTNRGSPAKGGSARGSGADSGESQSSPARGHRNHHNANCTSTTGSGSSTSDGTSSSTRDGDLLAHAASALRRLHFKSAGGSRSCRSTVPKVVVRDSSNASETTINTSTDSANTMITMVTTTDSEQPDDSLDLIDGLPEMSPPPVANESSIMSNNCSAPSSNGSPLSDSNNAAATLRASSNNLVQQQERIIVNGNANVVNAKGPTSPAASSSTISVSSISGTTIGTLENQVSPSAGVPPPTPLAGARQESRFSFATGRTPLLPDLRTTDFFSTPVRGSVDAGQPDPQQLNSMLALVASKDKGSKSNVTTSNTATLATSPKNSQHGPQTEAGTQQQQTQLTQSDKQQVPGGITGGGTTMTTTTSTKSSQKQQPTPGKPSINVTTNPLDISLCGATPPCGGGAQNANVTGRGRGRAAGGSGTGSKRSAQATIVVQQPSLSLDAPAATILLRPDAEARRREENMRQLLDVANTLTLQEIHDFEMRYGSPHHSRSQSVKTPGSRSSGRPNYLCLPQQRSRVASMPNTGVEEEYYRQRHFSITPKGIVNRGDSLKSRRSRSNNSVASSNSSTEHLTASYPGSARNSAAGSLASSRESSASQGTAPYRVLMLGAPAVGKSSLVSQFMTSEHLLVFDTSIDDESGEKTVSVLLAGEESELTFIDHSYADMAPEACISSYEPHAYCVVYSTTDRTSVRVAEELLQILWRSDHVSARAVILVGNKVDLVRCRLVSIEEGQSMATSYDCKFIETSVGLNHNVDELLVGLLKQIRLKLENPERNRDLFRRRSRKNRSKSPLGSCSENNSPKKYRGSRTSASLKVRHLLDKVWARDSKSKSCENLHVL